MGLLFLMGEPAETEADTIVWALEGASTFLSIFTSLSKPRIGSFQGPVSMCSTGDDLAQK